MVQIHKARKSAGNGAERVSGYCQGMKWAGMLFSSVVLGAVLMIFVYALPTEPMRRNVARSSRIFDYERIFPELVNSYAYTRLDNFTDSLMLGAAIYKGNEPLLERAMQNYHIDSQDLPPDLAMTNYANEVEQYDYYKVSYGRYWHGYLVPLKVLLLFFDYGDIRILNFFFQSYLLYYVIKMLFQKKQGKYIRAYLISIFVLNPLTTALSIQFSTVYYIILLSCACLLRMYKEGEAESKKINDLFFLTGIATSYFDFLTYPLAGAGILLVLYLNLYGGLITGKQYKSCIGKIILWCMGYGGMWSGKWLIGTLLTKTDFFRYVLEQGKIRTSVDGYTRLETLFKNLQVFFRWPFLLVCLMLFFYYIRKLQGEKQQMIFRKKRNWKDLWKRNRTRIFLYAIISLLPAVWMCVMANHSWVHYWFTYREFSISAFALFSLAAYMEKGTK